jgi:hypothetical protein
MVDARLPSNCVPVEPDHLVYLCHQMREEEREQYTVMTGQIYHPGQAARRFINAAGDAPRLCSVTVVGADGYPAVAGGYEYVSPGVWQSWMLGTAQGWAGHWRSITKASRWVADRAFDIGAHRLQIQCLTSRRAALTWFDKALGFSPEGVMRGYGPAGQDVALYARLRGD